MLEKEVYEWNSWRKLWHFGGCLLMIVIYFLWKDLAFFGGRLSGVAVLVALAWWETALCLAIDVLCFYFPAYRKRKEQLPGFGKIMRAHEADGFNASTYYLLASAILITFCRLGWCRDEILIMALLVLGASDPAAAWVRWQFFKRSWPNERIWGLLAFIASSYLAILLVNYFGADKLTLRQIFCIGAGVAMVETYTKNWVAFVRPLTRRAQNAIRHRAIEWTFKFYPDDNLVIPLLVAGLAVWFSG